MRETLKISEDEWKIIGPRIDAVQTAAGKLSGRSSFFGGRGGFGGPGGDGGRGRGGRDGDRDRPEDETEVAKKSSALRDIVQDEDASSDAIKKALSDLRAARKKAEADLAKARDELRQVLTMRQEALLVMMRTLD